MCWDGAERVGDGLWVNVCSYAGYLSARAVGAGAGIGVLCCRTIAVRLPQCDLESLVPTRKPKKNMMRRCASCRLAMLVAVHATTGVVLCVFGILQAKNVKYDD